MVEFVELTQDRVYANRAESVSCHGWSLSSCDVTLLESAYSLF